MARNEEKQLARLNRFYLQKQNEEKLAKRPPRPRLDTLSTLDDVKKWIPSILKDIEFYIKQMEVSCYPKKTIEEFERRIGQLRGEYKAFVRKAHELEPSLEVTPWTDRPYSAKRPKLSTEKSNIVLDNNEVKEKSIDENGSQAHFVSIATPVLAQGGACSYFYGNRNLEYQPLFKIDGEGGSDTGNINADQDLPLDFKDSSRKDQLCSQDLPLKFDFKKDENHKSAVTSIKVVETSSIGTCQQQVINHNRPLDLPYSDSSSDEGT